MASSKRPKAHAGRLLLRLTVGSLFIGHGSQKLYGWFGGRGPQATGESFEQMGMRPGKAHAQRADAAEALGGSLLVAGMFTPLAATMLTSVMATAVRKIHAKNGVWATEGGFEYNAVIVAALAALVEQGAGRPSFDAALLPRAKGSALAVASIAAGVAGSYLNEMLFNQPAGGNQEHDAHVDGYGPSEAAAGRADPEKAASSAA